MPEDNTTKPALFNLPEIPESVDNAVKNLTDYPTLNIGKTFGDLWFLVFGGISHKADLRKIQYAADLEKYQTELDNAISSIPKEKQIEPSIQVTAQALENSKYCVSSEILRQMFVRLISGTMHKDIEPRVHPSFPETLKQLSESDAILLKYISSSRSLPIVNMSIRDEKGNSRTMYYNFFIPSSFNADHKVCSLSISALQRFGLIEVRYDQQISTSTFYEKYKQTEEYAILKATLPRIDEIEKCKHSIHLERGILRLTELGKSFIEVCV